MKTLLVLAALAASPTPYPYTIMENVQTLEHTFPAGHLSTFPSVTIETSGRVVIDGEPLTDGHGHVARLTPKQRQILLDVYSRI